MSVTKISDMDLMIGRRSESYMYLHVLYMNILPHKKSTKQVNRKKYIFMHPHYQYFVLVLTMRM